MRFFFILSVIVEINIFLRYQSLEGLALDALRRAGTSSYKVFYCWSVLNKFWNSWIYFVKSTI